MGAEIVFQRREQHDVLFNRGFEEYERGFGDICGSGDKWLGLQKLHILTQTGKWNVRISMRQFSDNASFWGEWTGKKDISVIIKQLSQIRLQYKKRTTEKKPW